ncbi:hypothetical protein RFI_17788 [Reticulomyxa filosa]|uniref:Membrane transport protein MMPL domain-containing protein n=1 Tax=Reticulomyxa filosa TaxID=46433 RepID=X6N2B2_RETFI|nr:hypothetical protein RFI_17788 [Reticulomyxa filosa]|eukprot:ETO19442.1 hypothetical protein RFI_17788 [Reticulomyxa filosa]
MRPVAEYGFNVNPFAPSIMMSVTVAMSIDYSLFLLTRFREEIEKQIKHGRTVDNVDVTAAIRQVTRWSGKVVAFSGFILSITYVGLVFYPMVMLQSVGLGASIAVMCTILINLTCTPALLLMFPDFFKVLGCQLPVYLQRLLARLGIKLPSQSAKYDKFINEEDNFEGPERNLIAQASINAPSNQPVDASHSLNIRTEDEISAYRKKPTPDAIHPFTITEEERANPCNRCWYECGSYSTLWPYSLIIIFVVYALIAPVGWRIVELRKQLEDTLIFPRNSEYLDTYEEVKQDFSAGALAPWYIIIPDPNFSPSNASRNVRSWVYIHDTGMIMTNLFHQLAISNYNMTTSIGISAFKDKNF